MEEDALTFDINHQNYNHELRQAFDRVAGLDDDRVHIGRCN